MTRIAQKYDDNEIKKLDIIGINGVDEKKDSINKDEIKKLKKNMKMKNILKLIHYILIIN